MDKKADTQELFYAGFARRTLALTLDTLLFITLAVVVWWMTGKQKSLLLEVELGLGVGLACVAYTILFHAKWGQTLGKMAAGIRVTTLDGRPIGYKHAVLRNSVDLVLCLLYAVGACLAIWSWTGPDYATLDAAEKHRLLASRNPTERLYSVLSSVWTWSEVIVLLFNEKRRALHDFIAGTVVIQVSGKRPSRRSIPLRYMAVDVPLFMIGFCLLASCILTAGSRAGIIFRVLIGAFLMIPGILTFRMWKRSDSSKLL